MISKISTIIKNIVKNKNNDIDNYKIYIKLLDLILKILKYNNIKNMKLILNSNKYNTDEEFSTYIYNKFVKNYKKALSNNMYTQGNLIKSQYYLNILQKNNNSNINNYIDIGCGNCNVSYLFGKKLGIKEKNIFGADIKQWFHYEKDTRNKLINFIELKTGEELPIKNESYDLVSLFMVLHHVFDKPQLIKNINRILKKNKYLLITDHDIHDIHDNDLVDLEHFFYSRLFERDQDFYNDYYGEYLNIESMIDLLKLNNFKIINKGFYNIYKNKIEITSTRYFYILVQKI